MHRQRIGTTMVAVIAASVAFAGANLASASETVTTFTATLSGDEEVPEEGEVETTATGDATFELSADGAEMSYTVNVSGLNDVNMAHIHLAPTGENGPVVVWLHPEGPPPELLEGTTDGLLASGTFTADDLMEDLAGGTLEDLVAEMVAGNAYVNAHTEVYPAGEIRGQIVAGDGAVEQPDRVDTGAGGTAGSTNVGLAILAGLAAVTAAAVLVVRRRVRE